VEVAHRDDQVYRISAAISGVIDIQLNGTDIGADLGRKTGIRYDPERLAFTCRCCRGTGFDDVNSDIGQSRSDLELFVRG
jgi:hypothetical protein